MEIARTKRHTVNHVYVSYAETPELMLLAWTARIRGVFGHVETVSDICCRRSGRGSRAHIQTTGISSWRRTMLRWERWDCGMRYAPRGFVRKPSYHDSCSLRASPRIVDPFPRPQLEVEVSASLEINRIDGHWLASTYHHYCSVFREPFWLPTRTENSDPFPLRKRRRRRCDRVDMWACHPAVEADGGRGGSRAPKIPL